MTRRERKDKERRKNSVVFLDANISIATAIHLEDLQGLAHWVSFDAFREFPEERNGGKYHYSKIRRQRIRDFFDRIGDRNLFEKEGTPPHRMKDDELLSYMARLMEEVYSGRQLYLFFTHDKRFFTQELIRYHPKLYLFTDGKLVYIPMDTSKERGRAVGETAGAIRRDFLERLDELAS